MIAIARWTGIVAAAAVLTVALPIGNAHAGVSDRQNEMKAREAFAAGRYDEALQLFAKLYAETLHPVYLRNIGRCHQKMRAPDKAIDAFRDYLAKAKKVSTDERAEIEGYIKDMEALRDEQARAAAPPIAPAPVGPPPPAAPPPPSSAANPMMLTASPAPAAAAPVSKRWWFWTAIGAVVAGGVVTAIVLSSGTTRPACIASINGGCQ